MPCWLRPCSKYIPEMLKTYMLVASPGLLERPSYPPHVSLEEFRYKIFVSGKSGVGKTSSIAKLTGNEVPTSHSETPGRWQHMPITFCIHFENYFIF